MTSSIAVAIPPTSSAAPSAAKRSVRPRTQSQESEGMSLENCLKAGKKILKSESDAVAADDKEIKSALNFMHARHPVKTAECVSGETGIPAKTVAQWLAGYSRPGWLHTIRLIEAYGPAFIAASCPKARKWVDPIVLTQKLAELERRRADILQELRQLSAADDPGGKMFGIETFGI